MYLTAIQVHIALYQEVIRKFPFDFLGKEYVFSDIFHDYKEVAPPDVNNIKEVKALFNTCDNNNGGLVIFIKKGGLLEEYTVKIGFLLGEETDYEDEGDGPFTRYVTPDEYGERGGGSSYSDKGFVEIFNSYCNYFHIGLLG